jgi:flagellar hook-length control protein FliK
MALGAQSENTNAPIAATPSTSATVIPMAVNQAPPTNPSTPNDQTLIEADVAIASKAQVNADSKRLTDTPQTGSANLNDTNRVTEIKMPVTTLSTNNKTSTIVSELSGDRLPAAEAASNATTNVANDPAMSNQGGPTATIDIVDVSSNLETISAAATANLNAVEKSVMQVTDSRSQEVQNSFNLSQTIPVAKMPGVSAAPSTKPEMTLAASARTDTTVSSAKTLDVNHATVTPAVNPATPQVSEKNTTTNLRPDHADLSLSGVGTNALFSDKLSAQFSQVQQEQNVLQKSEAIDEFAISAAKPEVIAAPPAIQTVMAAASSLATEHIGARFGTKAWDQAIGQKIVWMVAGGEQTAQLTLNPPDLGPVQVVLSISDSFVDASFVSSHLDVREAIEAAAPKLREMMDNAGISLSGFSVSADSAQSGNAFSPDKSQQSASSQLRNANKVDATVENTTQNMPTSRPSQAQGLVDTFA